MKMIFPTKIQKIERINPKVKTKKSKKNPYRSSQTTSAHDFIIYVKEVVKSKWIKGYLKKLDHFAYILEWKYIYEKIKKDAWKIYVQYRKSVRLSLQSIEYNKYKTKYLTKEDITEIKNKYEILD